MAEILLTAVINVLFQEGTRLYWLKEDIDWLQREMRHIRSYVDNAKAKEVGGDSRVKNLLKDIQQLAGDVEDLLDDFLPKIQQSNKFKSTMCCLKTACIPCANEFAMEIEKIKRRVADIDRVTTTYNIMDTSNNNNDDCIPLDQRRMFLHADETEVIGLDDDFNMLQSKLLDHDVPYRVVSIVGMPGLGKTTLAKKLYRHVRDQFECSRLVYVSQQPRAGEILRDLAKQVGLTEQERKENLQNNLRYIGGDFSIHVLQPLDSENSFELFTKKIFTFDNNNNWDNASPDLVDIGRSIVGRCGGIPLAIVVLALSYSDLSIALRPYFLYFGVYPEDHEIRAFDLTNMWIAEKLIVVNSGNGLCVDFAKESNFFHTEHNAFGDPGNVARVRRITFYSDNNAMNEFFRLNPKPTKLRALFCFTKDHCIFFQMAHLNFKLLQVLVVVISADDFCFFSIPNTFGNTSCLRYLQFEGDIYGKLPNCMVKLKLLETLDIGNSFIRLPVVWKSMQLRHLRCTGHLQASNCCSSIISLPPNNLQTLTLMWMDDLYFEPQLLHRLINLRELGILDVSDSTVKILSALSPVPKALEVLKLYFLADLSEQIKLSSYPNIVKLHLNGRMRLNSEAFPPNLVKLTLRNFEVEGNVVAVLTKLPKLRILKMVLCKHMEEKMDLSGDSFPQLEVLHILEPLWLFEITCTDDVSMPKLKKLLLIEVDSQIRLSERLAKLRV
ncbi:hypothetical protein KY289_037404 [Solanum tuberosum]|nr:hypothetical protein KY289_037404 [Solanum tuberosum]